MQTHAYVLPEEALELPGLLTQKFGSSPVYPDVEALVVPTLLLIPNVI